MYFSWKLLHTVNCSTPLLLFNLYLTLKAINLHCRHKHGPYRWHQPFIYSQKSHFSPEHQPSRGTICQKPSPDLQKPSKDLFALPSFSSCSWRSLKINKLHQLWSSLPWSQNAFCQFSQYFSQKLYLELSLHVLPTACFCMSRMSMPLPFLCRHSPTNSYSRSLGAYHSSPQALLSPVIYLAHPHQLVLIYLLPHPIMVPLPRLPCVCSSSIVVTAYDFESGRPGSSPDLGLIYYKALLTAQGLPEPSG